MKRKRRVWSSPRDSYTKAIWEMRWLRICLYMLGPENRNHNWNWRSAHLLCEPNLYLVCVHGGPSGPSQQSEHRLHILSWWCEPRLKWRCGVASSFFFVILGTFVCVVVTEKSVLVCASRKIYIVLALLKIGDFSGRVNCALGCQCQPFFPRKRYWETGRRDYDDNVDKTRQEETSPTNRIDDIIGPYRNQIRERNKKENVCGKKGFDCSQGQ